MLAEGTNAALANRVIDMNRGRIAAAFVAVVAGVALATSASVSATPAARVVLFKNGHALSWRACLYDVILR
jgi:hypothetical protein